jgi:PTH2 family peptidyl-tRNA hydrolase
MTDHKQIIVMRSDLNMRKGKMIAQGAHASMGAILPYVRMRPTRLSDDTPENADNNAARITRARWNADARRYEAVEAWLAGSFKKVCVRADSEDELLAVHDLAEDAGLITCLITDSGLTEFGGVPTITCCAIGPDLPENLDPITGELRLL